MTYILQMILLVLLVVNKSPCSITCCVFSYYFSKWKCTKCV